MKLVIIVSCLLGASMTAQIPDLNLNQKARIIYQNFDNNINGYSFGFAQSDGTKHEQKGVLKSFARSDGIYRGQDVASRSFPQFAGAKSEQHGLLKSYTQPNGIKNKDESLKSISQSNQAKYGQVGSLKSFAQPDGTKHDYDGSLNIFAPSNRVNYEKEGILKNVDQDIENLTVKGSYSWVGPDGVTYQIDYTADEDGFRPEISQGPGGAIPFDVMSSMAG